MKTKLFIDFDDTLFDRNKFRKDLFQILEDLDFTKEQMEESYRAVYHDGYDGIEAQLQYLHEKYGNFDLTDALQKSWNFLNDLKDYLYPEAVNFIKSIDQERYDVHILTVGGIDFQKTKVRNSGIEELVGEENCHYTVEDKDTALKNLVCDGEHFILVEDKLSTIEKVEKEFPDAEVFQAKDGDFEQFGSLKNESDTISHEHSLNKV